MNLNRTLEGIVHAPECLPARPSGCLSDVGSGLGYRFRGTVAAFIALLTFVTFLPALRLAFVEWDDYANFVTNFGYRGLSWSHVHWMLTSVQGGHWIPATWATFALDHAVWGMDPFGYHLTNVLLHSANAVVFFFLASRVLRLGLPEMSIGALQAGAAAAALLFGLHPLRVESVAWITERRDVLSGLFWMLAILAYLRAPEQSGRKAGGWKLLSLVCYQFAMMAKSITVTLPVILLILDVYPLRRHRDGFRCLLTEKAPYVPIMLFGVFMAFLAAQSGGYLTSLGGLSLVERLAVTSYSLWFYVSTTVAPFALSPLYELPPSMKTAASRFIVPTVMVVAITIATLVFRRRWPAFLAAWVAYAIILSPVSGMLHNGSQLVADRYSYLSCLPWALLFGAMAAAIVTKMSTPAKSARVRSWAAAVACLLALLVLPPMTSRQLRVWRDGETLWRYTLAINVDCSMCHYYFGQYLRNREQPALAIEHFSRAERLRPALGTLAVYRVNRGLAYLAIGEINAAERDLAAARSVAPALAEDVSPAFIAVW
jgi:protein O-mannosyl-transferase